MNPNTAYEVHIDSPVDVIVALRCEADRAEREQFPNVAKRQRALALHIENAIHHLQPLAPEGFRLALTLDFHFTANVNPGLKPEFRKDA